MLLIGGHRVPFLSWWPLGTHKALQGTNFDLPVSQIDFFATFADILNYPLPSKEKCVYSYDSNTAAVHNQERFTAEFAIFAKKEKK